MSGIIKIVDLNPSGVIVSDSSSSSNTGSGSYGGYGYQLELKGMNDVFDITPVVFDI